MKKNQFFETGDYAANRYLQKELHLISKGCYAIQHVLHCFNEMQSLEPKGKDGDFSFLDLVEGSALADAMELLGLFIHEKSNDLCKRFGLSETG